MVEPDWDADNLMENFCALLLGSSDDGGHGGKDNEINGNDCSQPQYQQPEPQSFNSSITNVSLAARSYTPESQYSGQSRSLDNDNGSSMTSSWTTHASSASLSSVVFYPPTLASPTENSIPGQRGSEDEISAANFFVDTPAIYQPFPVAVSVSGGEGEFLATCLGYNKVKNPYPAVAALDRQKSSAPSSYLASFSSQSVCDVGGGGGRAITGRGGRLTNDSLSVAAGEGRESGIKPILKYPTRSNDDGASSSSPFNHHVAYFHRYSNEEEDNVVVKQGVHHSVQSPSSSPYRHWYDDVVPGGRATDYNDLNKPINIITAHEYQQVKDDREGGRYDFRRFEQQQQEQAEEGIGISYNQNDMFLVDNHQHANQARSKPLRFDTNNYGSHDLAWSRAENNEVYYGNGLEWSRAENNTGYGNNRCAEGGPSWLDDFVFVDSPTTVSVENCNEGEQGGGWRSNCNEQVQAAMTNSILSTNTHEQDLSATDEECRQLTADIHRQIQQQGNPLKRSPPPGYMCHICKQAGHFIKDCPQDLSPTDEECRQLTADIHRQIQQQENPLKRSPPPGYMCHICKQAGHFIKDCPQKYVESSNTPYKGSKRCWGEYLCKKCKRKWWSINSYARASKKCNKCDILVFPHKQLPVDEAERRGLTKERWGGRPVMMNAAKDPGGKPPRFSTVANFYQQGEGSFGGNC